MAPKNRANSNIEYRVIKGAAPAADGKHLQGRAAPFDSPTMIGSKPWGFRESISTAAFNKTIHDGDIVLLDNHDAARPLARQSADTLLLTVATDGLDWEAEPAKTSYALDVVENVRAGNYGGCSFGFEVIKDKWDYNADDGVDERTLLEVKLHEISICTFPAYGETTVDARDAVSQAMECRDRFYERQSRAKYSADELVALGKKGHAFLNSDGHYSYPVDDDEDLHNAIRAVGRGGADHNAIRKYIIGRAKSMGHSDWIPENWSSDGSIKEANADAAEQEVRGPTFYLAGADIRNLAVQIRKAKTLFERQAAIDLAIEMKLPEMLPDNWNREGNLFQPNDASRSAAHKDMMSIRDLAAEMPATTRANSIIDIAETYLRNDEKKASEPQAPETSKPATSTLTREDAQRQMALARDRFKNL